MHEVHHEGHGHSVAAWVAVGVMLAASAVMTWAFIDPNVTLFVVGAVIFGLGALAWPLLSRLGYGDKHKPRTLYPDHQRS